MVNEIQKPDNHRTPCLPLPVRTEDVTREWLEAALRSDRPGLRLDSAAVVDVMPGTSTKIRVRLETRPEDRLPSTLIVKGGFEAHSPAMAPMYHTEMRYYRDVQGRVPIPSPACFFAGADPSSHQSIVILEDLTARNVRFCDALEPESAESVAKRLTVMARYHAATWNSTQFAKGGVFDWVSGRHEGWSVVYQDHYLEPARWEHYMSLPRAAVVAPRLRDREWMRSALRRLGRQHALASDCLCHGDTHLGNLYVDPDGTPGFFDPQVARCPALFEVTYHIVGALAVAERRRHEQSLLRHYLEELQRFGIDAPQPDAAWLSYRSEIAYGLFIFLINETRFQTEAINTAYTTRFGAAAIDHGTHELLAET